MLRMTDEAGTAPAWMEDPVFEPVLAGGDVSSVDEGESDEPDKHPESSPWSHLVERAPVLVLDARDDEEEDEEEDEDEEDDFFDDEEEEDDDLDDELEEDDFEDEDFEEDEDEEEEDDDDL